MINIVKALLAYLFVAKLIVILSFIACVFIYLSFVYKKWLLLQDDASTNFNV